MHVRYVCTHEECFNTYSYTYQFYQFYVKTFPFLSPYIIFEECKCISYGILIRQLKISTTLEQINKVLSQLIIDKSENLNHCVNIFYYTAPKFTYATYTYYTIN